MSGEDADVWPHRKPAREIFDVARARAAALDGGESGAARGELGGGGGWVHVGDDLVNDVAASKRAGAATVWFDPPPPAAAAASDARAPAQQQAAFSTIDEDEASRRRAANAAVDAGRVVDARIGALDELPDAIAIALERAARGGGG